MLKNVRTIALAVILATSFIPAAGAQNAYKQCIDKCEAECATKPGCRPYYCNRGCDWDPALRASKARYEETRNLREQQALEEERRTHRERRLRMQSRVHHNPDAAPGRSHLLQGAITRRAENLARKWIAEVLEERVVTDPGPGDGWLDITIEEVKRGKLYANATLLSPENKVVWSANSSGTFSPKRIDRAMAELLGHEDRVEANEVIYISVGYEFPEGAKVVVTVNALRDPRRPAPGD